jgi:hypothetical protein
VVFVLESSDGWGFMPKTGLRSAEILRGSRTALMQRNEPTTELDALRKLPVEKRYVWRIASALKWGFADFDDLGVDADRRQYRRKISQKLRELLQLRPI